MSNQPTNRRVVPLATWHITHEEIVRMLTLRNATHGRPCPVAAALVERLESVGV